RAACAAAWGLGAGAAAVAAFLFLMPLTPSSSLFPYTTLFRSLIEKALGHEGEFPPCVGILSNGPCGDVNSTDRMPNAEVVEYQRSEEHTSQLQSRENLVCRLLPEKRKRSARLPWRPDRPRQ